MTEDNGLRTAHPAATVEVPAGPLGLRVDLSGPTLRFSYDAGEGWRGVPVELDATILSDEHVAHTGVVAGRDHPGFTGAFVGMWVMDMAADGFHADFDHARYEAMPAFSGSPSPDDASA